MKETLSQVICLTALLIFSCCTMHNDEGIHGENDMAKHSSTHKQEAHELKNFTHHIIHQTPYYIDGPQQNRPPDGYFSLGVRLAIIENNGSYALVESDSGVKAYVALLDMKAL